MSDDIRAVPGGYGPRYSPFSTYAPQPSPATYYSGHRSDDGQACDIPAGWDPYAVLRRYAQAAATNDHAEEKTA